MSENAQGQIFILVFAGVILVCAVIAVIAVLTSDQADDFRAWLRASVGRGRAVVAARRKTVSRAAHIQQARMTLDLAELGPADLTGADRLDGSWLRKAARSQVAELGAALSAPDGDPADPADPADLGNPGRDRALACYDAAALLVAERDGQLDMLGAIVLAREGQAALTDRDPHPLPVCQVHPLHGPAIRRPRPGQRSRRPRDLLAVCAGCKGCSVPERDKMALLAGGMPYYRAGGFWASVGFGALDAELPTRVLEYLGVE
jgi:hypothetical protein